MTTATATPAGLDLENPIHLAVKNRLLELESALLARDPMMPRHLAEIHKHMIQHEEIVHLLSNDEIAKIMAAQQHQTNTTLVASVTTTKARSATNKKATGLGMSDL